MAKTKPLTPKMLKACREYELGGGTLRQVGRKYDYTEDKMKAYWERYKRNYK